MKKIVILATILIGLIAAGVWYYSDKNVVIRKTSQLLECFEKEESDGLLTGVLNEDNFRDLLDKKVALDFEHRDMPDMRGGIKQDRDKLARSYLYAMKSIKMVKLTEKEITLENIDNKSAQVNVTMHGEVKHSQYGLDSDMNIELHFNKTENEGWRISQITVKKQ